ncbi:MAG: hypothetical protein HWQ40_15825 [Nostoc sp. NMS9]|nr:hypothetical protein [Nostoc sp. NMS9]
MVNVVLSDAINHHKDAINRRLYKRLIIGVQGSKSRGAWVQGSRGEVAVSFSPQACEKRQ